MEPCSGTWRLTCFLLHRRQPFAAHRRRTLNFTNHRTAVSATHAPSGRRRRFLRLHVLFIGQAVVAVQFAPLIRAPLIPLPLELGEEIALSSHSANFRPRRSAPAFRQAALFATETAPVRSESMQTRFSLHVGAACICRDHAYTMRSKFGAPLRGRAYNAVIRTRKRDSHCSRLIAREPHCRESAIAPTCMQIWSC